MISSDFFLFEFIHSLLLNICVFYFCWKRGINPFTSILFYFVISCILFSTEVLRESLAIGVFLLNYKNIEEKKWLRYYCFAIVSIGLHYSAVVTLIFPFFSNLKLSIKMIPYLVFYAVFVYFLIQFVDNGIPIAKLAARYAESTSFKETHDLTVNRYIALIIKSVLFVGGILYYSKKYKIECNNRYQSMLLLYAILSLTAIIYPNFFDRLSNYCVPFYFLCFGNCIYILRKKNALRYFVLLSISMIFFLHTNVRENTLARFYPYHSIIDKKIELKREQMYFNETF